MTVTTLLWRLNILERERDYCKARVAPQDSNSGSNNNNSRNNQAWQPCKDQEGKEVVPMET